MRNIRGRVQIKIFAGTVYRHYIKGTGSNISATRYADYKRSGIKYFPRMKMPEYFYFLSDKYCEQFADCEIMGNKEGTALIV